MSRLAGLIMAAGLGTRMGILTRKIPKPLLPVASHPLIEYGINFLKLIGVDKIVIVGGFQFNKLKEVINKIDSSAIVLRNNYYRRGNIFSVQKGLEVIEESFFLYHADHIYQKEISQKIKNQLKKKIIAFSDNDRRLGDDDMKIKTDNSGQKLEKISKQLNNNLIGYVGLTYVDKNFLNLYKKSIPEVIKKYGDQAVSENLMEYLVTQKGIEISIGDISGFRWHEIDTYDDYQRAEKIISKYHEQYL